MGVSIFAHSGYLLLEIYTLRIAILSRNKKLYSTRRLKDAGELRGHQVDVIDTLHCYMDVTRSRPAVRYAGEQLPYYDAVIPRIGASITFYGTAVVRQFEMMGTFSVNESVAISRSRDKLRSCLLYTSPSPRDRTRTRMPSFA